MAECHPVGFQWVMEAKRRGATIIHVDPRFTRTSAVADIHVPIRAGTDIAFLGGVINHILANGREFREYVLDYTNAAVIVDEDFVDTEDLDGLFSGYDPDTSWLADQAAIDWFLERTTDQSFACLTAPWQVELPSAPSKTYVFATASGPSRFKAYAEAVRGDERWSYHELDGPHFLMFSHPEEVATILLGA